MDGTGQGPEMIPARRRALIVESARRHGAVSVAEMAVALAASAATIRRDIEHLTEHGYLVRARGGAILPTAADATFEPEAAIAKRTAEREKEAIGRAAAELVAPGQTLILDSGSTTLAAACALAARRIPVTAVTNDLVIAGVLGRAAMGRVIVTGGTLRPGSNTLLGEPGEALLRNLHAEVAFLGAHAVSGAVMTETSLDAARFKREVMTAARRVVLLVDHTKFGEPAFCTIGSLDTIHAVVTDDRTPPDVVESLRERGLAVTVADVGGVGGPAQRGRVRPTTGPATGPATEGTHELIKP